MKKFLTLALALAMVLTLSINVFAVEYVGSESGTKAESVPTNNTSIEVNAETQANPEDKVYRVDIAWEAMTFTYTEGNQGTWNPTNHTYSNPEVGTWSDAAKITVTNHSNAPVSVDATCNKETGNDGLAITFEKTADADDDDKLTAGVVDEFETADKIEYTVSVSGTLTTPGKVATISIVIE